MPTYNQAGFIKRAILSLQRQTFQEWELIIINDGCTDYTDKMVESFLSDPRIIYLRNDRNRGLGYSVNRGLDRARYDFIAYLPSDDYYDPDHLASLAEYFGKFPNAVLVYSGVRYGMNDTMTYSPRTESTHLVPGRELQMVQVAHRTGKARWVERSEWEDGDLNVTFWNKLLDEGSFVATGTVSCFFTRHPKQRHRLIFEGSGGGLNVYRSHYNVKDPLKIRFHKDKFIDEEKNYALFRRKPTYRPDGLKILLVGELAYNPERIAALEAAGHKLYGLWLNRGMCSFNTVGPLPFANVEDIEFDGWRQRVRELKPDIIYAMLNFPSIPLAYDVLRENPDIPFVWHFKEAATISLQIGSWEKLLYLYNHADGVIHISPLVKDWVGLFANPRGESMIMDGDLPNAVHFEKPFTPRLSDTDEEVHTMVAGRMIGLRLNDMRKLAQNGIHLHLYSQGKYQQRETANSKFSAVAPGYFHVHQHCGIQDWVNEFSRYDAGWLHMFDSRNRGDLFKASWDDLNVPARMSTYAAAGLPMILKRNSGNMTSTNQIVEGLGIGVGFDSIDQLIAELKDRRSMDNKRSNVLKCRTRFTFDHYVPELIDFFKEVIKKKKTKCPQIKF